MPSSLIDHWPARSAACTTHESYRWPSLRSTGGDEHASNHTISAAAVDPWMSNHCRHCHELVGVCRLCRSKYVFWNWRIAVQYFWHIQQCIRIEALTSNTSGIANTATGYWALRNNTSGHANDAYGVAALQLNTTGTNNTAIGAGALTRNTTGTSNTALGYTAMVSNTTGFGNTSTGDTALMGNVTGNYNTAIGNDAMTGNNAGELNTATGWSALYYHDAGTNSAFGAYAMFGNPVHEKGGTQNTAAGAYALYGNYGSRNTAIGYRAMLGTEEVFGSVLVTVTGSDNTAVGMNALFNLTTGNGNTATGLNALYGNMTGLRNTASGVGALKNNSSGVRNAAFGYQAGLAVTGSDNITIGGRQSGQGCRKWRNSHWGFRKPKKDVCRGHSRRHDGPRERYGSVHRRKWAARYNKVVTCREGRYPAYRRYKCSLACAAACYVPLQGSKR